MESDYDTRTLAQMTGLLERIERLEARNAKLTAEIVTANISVEGSDNAVRTLQSTLQGRIDAAAALFNDAQIGWTTDLRAVKADLRKALTREKRLKTRLATAKATK
jgi:uncharacterized protein (UPF0335 family)